MSYSSYELKSSSSTTTMTMTTPTKHKDLYEFLSKHFTKNMKDTMIDNDVIGNESKKKEKKPTHTHTRIKSKPEHLPLKVSGGNYIIPREDETEFYKHYCHHVFTLKKPEYLTEKQLEDTGPLVVDVDLRYNHSVSTRKHTNGHITDLIELYLEVLRDEFFQFDQQSFPVFVFQKPTVNRLDDGSLTKDGIHFIFGIQMDHTLQILLREKIVERVDSLWHDLPIINTWDGVFDEGISKGTANWQLYGSCKPGYDTYTLTQHFICYLDHDNEFAMNEKPFTSQWIIDNFRLLTVRYEHHVKFELKPSMQQELDTRKQKGKLYRARKDSNKTKIKLLKPNGGGNGIDIGDEDGDDDDEERDGTDSTRKITLEEIDGPVKLQLAIDQIMESLSAKEFFIKEAHEYTQILPEKYYEPGSHLNNCKVAFALKNTSDKLFLSWIQLRSKASDFEYTIENLNQCLTRWNNYFKKNPEGLSIRSLIYWAKQDAYDEYIQIKKNSRDYYIEQTFSSPTDYDFAQVLYQMFKDTYVCSMIKPSVEWYVFENHRWVVDEGDTIRLRISEEMYDAYQAKIASLMNEMHHFNGEDERYKRLSHMVKTGAALSLKLKDASDKNSILREAVVLFYDKNFFKTIDTNRWLLGFTNGVLDIQNQIFRPGQPQDYITKSTNLPYEPIDNVLHAETIEEINKFMESVFTDPSLREYMWEHLASCLIGENKNQVFHIYLGVGSNGKSQITDLMQACLGDYFGSVPITLLTEKRQAIGNATPELMALKAIRYAVTAEPCKGEPLREGMMKQLTGDSKISGRELFHKTETFRIQFNLVVCTNVLFEMNTNDDGTWRRIRICNFESKFLDEDDFDQFEDIPTHLKFLKDKTIPDKLQNWASVFIAMLVQRAFKNQGIVNACAKVKASSNSYRQSEDHIAGFVADKIEKCPGKSLRKETVHGSFKQWYKDMEGTRKCPKQAELFDYMDKKFGKSKKTFIINPDGTRKANGMGWENICFTDDNDTNNGMSIATKFH